MLRAQVAGHLFCGRNWYCEMTKDPDGNIYPAGKGTEKDHMSFNCDSTFVLVEDTVTLKGKWKFEEEEMVITLVQQQIATMPGEIAFHIIDHDEGHLVLIGQKGTAGERTMYLYTK
ncbi:hypothetical protein [Nemorincola caseinilytica]|uniref:hypothetical protein n=1 Tax=Nemorincola caseinilytica TaxID=2054315 RepID=UPI0031ECCDC2